MSRKISFCLSSHISGDDWKNSQNFDFAQYCVLLYYSSKINNSEGRNFLNASISKFTYSYDNDLSVLNQSESKGNASLFNLQQVIIFLNNQVIPSLQNEVIEKDLVIDEYGGVVSFISSYYLTSYLKSCSVFEDEIEPEYTGYIPNVLDCAVKIKIFFQSVISNNDSYEVIVF